MSPFRKWVFDGFAKLFTIWLEPIPEKRLCYTITGLNFVVVWLFFYYKIHNGNELEYSEVKFVRASKMNIDQGKRISIKEKQRDIHDIEPNVQ